MRLIRKIFWTVFLSALLTACKVVTGPSRLEVARLGPTQAVESKLAEVELSYRKYGFSAELSARERDLLTAWLDRIEMTEGPLTPQTLGKFAQLRWTGSDPVEFERLLPASRVRPAFTKKRKQSDGVGLPVVVYQAAPQGAPDFAPSGRPHFFTARLLPRESGPPVLELVDTMERSQYTIAGRNLPLGADYSAPTDYHWTRSSLDDTTLSGVLRPGEVLESPILYLTEDYDPDKIPLVFIHGLKSSPVIWAPVSAEIRYRPALRDRYQIWHYAYPSGLPWLSTSATFRRLVRKAHARLDPSGTNPNWNRMLIIGHSMGGLVTRVAVSQKSEAFYETVFDVPMDQLQGTRGEIERIRRGLIVEPMPEPAVAMFIATPHRGATMADWGVVHWIAGLIKFPADVATNTMNILTGNQFALTTQILNLEHLPTSLDMLSPKSPFVLALQQISIREDVKIHSVVGVRDFSLFGDEGDGVVPYWSAHLPQADSEIRVPYGHSMTRKPLVIEEILRVLEARAN